MIRAAAAALLLCFFGADARAQGSDIVNRFLGSSRDVALGESAALADPGPFALHGNPARMLRFSGIGAAYSHSQLVPDFADDVFIDHYGVCVSSGWWAAGVSYSWLDQGSGTITDIGGNPIGEYDAHQSSLRIGGALDLFTMGGREPSEFDPHLRVGLSGKYVDDELASDAVTQPSAEGSGLAFDAGLELAATLQRADDSGRPSVELQLAVSYDDLLQSEIDYGDQGKDEFHRFVHFGLAIELGFLESAEFGRVVGLLMQYGISHSREGAYDDIHHRGVELELARVASVRIGHETDDSGGLDAPIFGFGLRLGWIGLPPALRFDYVSRPQSRGLSFVDQWSLQGSFAFGG